MTAAFRSEPEASAELEHAAVWYEKQRPGLGAEFLEAVDVTLDRIAQFPRMGHLVAGVPSDVPARRVPVRRFPYHVVYMVWRDVIRILAFAHDSREPGYWVSPTQK